MSSGYTVKKRNPWALVDQSFLAFFITYFLMEFTNRGSGIIDGLFVSNFLDVDAIASVGISKSIYPAIGMVSGLFSVGMQSVCAHKIGKGNVKDFNRIFSAIFYLSIPVSAVFTVAIIVFAKPFAVLMGASGKGAVLVDGAALYLRGIGIGFPAIMLGTVLSAACQLDSAMARVRKSSLVYFVVNVALDYAAVRLHLGVFGIALATSVAYYVQFAYLLLHFRTKDRMLRFVKLRINVKEFMETLSLGTEQTLRSFSNFIAPVVVARIILLFGGTIAMSAFSVQKDLIAIVEMFATALAKSTALLAGVYYGELNKEGMRAAGKSAHKVCAVFLGACCLILVVFSRQVARIYISDPGELFEMVVFASIITGLYAPVNALVRARISYLNSIRKVRSMQIMSFLSSIVYTIISAYALGALFGSYGVLASNLLRVVLLALTVWLYHVLRTRKLIPTVDDYLALPESFDLKPGDVISLDIVDPEDISLAAEQIQLFGKGHGIDKATGMRAAVCFEELAANIIRFGFPKCKKRPAMNLRLVISDSEIVMRVSDNCPMFDVERYIAQEMDNADDGEIRLGLKIIAGLGENISYVHSLENNNVIVRFSM